MLEKYGAIADGKLNVVRVKEQYLSEAERLKAVNVISKDGRLKKIKFAPIPEFDQTKQAVYQGSPVDKGDYIEVGVKVVDVPPEKEPIFDEPIKEEPVIKK